MHVTTDHRIVPHGADKMALVDEADGLAIVVATRAGTQWTVSAAAADDVTTNNRNEAIDAMIEMALAVSPEDGYSTLVPHFTLGVGEKPVSLRDIP